MKKLKLNGIALGLLGLLFSTSYTPTFSQKAGCVTCTEGSRECQRVITEDQDADGSTVTTVHIFHGKPEAC